MNAESDRVMCARGLGLYSQDTEEEQVWVILVSETGSIVSRSNQDLTVMAQRQ